MSDKHVTTFLNTLKAHGHSRHSDAYRWLRDHHAAISDVLAIHRPSWITIASALTQAGVLGTKGQELTPKNARRIWMRVCRDLANEQEARRQAELVAASSKEPKRFNPSRLPKNFRPDVVIAPPVPYSARASPDPILPGSSGNDPLTSEEQSNLDRFRTDLLHDLEQADRHIIRSSKK